MKCINGNVLAVSFNHFSITDAFLGISAAKLMFFEEIDVKI